MSDMTPEEAFRRGCKQLEALKNESGKIVPKDSMPTAHVLNPVTELMKVSGKIFRYLCATNAVDSLEVIKDIRDDTENMEGVRLAAAVAIVDRSGLAKQNQDFLTLETVLDLTSMSIREAIAQIVNLQMEGTISLQQGALLQSQLLQLHEVTKLEDISARLDKLADDIEQAKNGPSRTINASAAPAIEAQDAQEGSAGLADAGDETHVPPAAPTQPVVYEF